MDDKDVKPSGATSPMTSESTNVSVPTNPTATPAPAVLKTGGKKLFGKLSILPAAVIAGVIIAGGSAAAYFGVIVPNKPENVLKTAIANTLEQKKAKFDGKFVYESTDSGAAVKAVNVSFNGQSDAEKNAFGASFEVSVSGVKLPFEVRSVDKSIYFKIGNLASIKDLVELAAPGYGSTVDAVNEKLADQWIEIDETLLKQAGMSCSLGESFAPTKEDVELVLKRYGEIPFTVIKSTSSETLNGREAIKYEMDLDDNKGAEFVKSLEDLTFVKKLKACQGSSEAFDTKTLADNDITPITVWVDKGSKTIAKFAMYSTKQDEEKSKAKGSFEINTQYGSAEITKPEGAKPAIEFMNDLQSLFLGQVQGQLEGANIQDMGSFDF